MWKQSPEFQNNLLNKGSDKFQNFSGVYCKTITAEKLNMHAVSRMMNKLDVIELYYTFVILNEGSKYSENLKLLIELGPFQTPLQSCAEPNKIKFDLRASSEQRLIQTTYIQVIW